MYELHFAVPMAGAILSPINTRLDSSMLSVLLSHSQPKIMLVGYEFLKVARGAFKILSEEGSEPPSLVLITEVHDDSVISGGSIGEYESLLETGEAEFETVRPTEEWDPISLSYTSGTTSSTPKGVVYSHRGAYLNSMNTILLNEMRSMPVYLWSVPMFHYNGWCMAWATAAQGGTNICLRNVAPEGIFACIVDYKVTHMGGAPAILNMMVDAAVRAGRRPVPAKVTVMTSGVPPPPRVLFEMEELGFSVVHSYGMTETYGPGTVCSWKPEWDSLPLEARAKLRSRQGVQHLGLEGVSVKDLVTMESVPRDGKTVGEVMFRGNTVMSGYWNDERATEEAFRGGWFRGGDLGVRHSDGYIEVKDLSKDSIDSGGEIVSSVEVESVIFGHSSVLEAAVVGRPDKHGKETLCAFVKLKEGCEATAGEIIEYCRARLPHHMVLRTVVFRGSAQDVDREDAEVRPPGEGEGHGKSY